MINNSVDIDYVDIDYSRGLWFEKKRSKSQTPSDIQDEQEKKPLINANQNREWVTLETYRSPKEAFEKSATMLKKYRGTTVLVDKVSRPLILDIAEAIQEVLFSLLPWGSLCKALRATVANCAVPASYHRDSLIDPSWFGFQKRNVPRGKNEEDPCWNQSDISWKGVDDYRPIAEDKTDVQNYDYQAFPFSVGDCQFRALGVLNKSLTDRWVLYSPGNGFTVKGTMESGQPFALAEELESNVLVLDYPNNANPEIMGQAYRVALKFLEEYKGATEIIGYGESMGAAQQAYGLWGYKLDEKIKYVFVKVQTFSRLTDIFHFILRPLMIYLGCHMSPIDVYRPDIAEVVINSAPKHDRVIPERASLSASIKDEGNTKKTIISNYEAGHLRIPVHKVMKKGLEKLMLNQGMTFKPKEINNKMKN